MHSPADSRLHARLITDPDDWRALGAGWDALVASAAGQGAFQSAAFLQCWWRHMATGATLWTVVVIRDGELVAAAPLQRVERRIWKRRYRVLEFIGMPNELDRPTLLVRPGDDEALDALLEAVAAHRDQWDLIQLDEIDGASPLPGALDAWARRHRLWCRSRDFHPCPYLAKDGDWDAYLGSRSARFRKRIRQAEKRFARAGTVEYEVAHKPDDLAALLDAYFDVERRSWKAAAGVDSGQDAAYRDFCRELLCDPAQPHTGHAIVQRLDGRPTAATFGLSRDGVYYSMQIAHDQACNAWSPGTLLEAFEMRWFFEQPQLTRYEFLGGVVLNKRRWTDTAVPTRQVFIRQPGLHIALKDLSRFHLQPWLRQQVRRIRPDREPKAPIEPFRTPAGANGDEVPDSAFPTSGQKR